MELNYVGTKTNQHLRSGLATYAAIDIGLAGEEWAELRVAPDVGDGIAHENDALFVFRKMRNGGVGFTIAGQIWPVLGYLLPTFHFFYFCGEFRAVSGFFCGFFGRRILLRGSGKAEEKK